VLVSENFGLVEFLFGTEWYPTSESNVRYGVFVLFIGTISVTGLAIVIAVPFAVGAAIFVSEFCSARVREVLKIVIELLAAIPSVVWGFIGYMVLNPLLITTTGAPIGINVLNGGIILALMSVPIIMSVGEDALKAVPDTYREAALALGASRWQVVYRVLLPAAKNGLLAAALLGIGRAVGETMAVVLAAGFNPKLTVNPLDQGGTMAAFIAQITSGDTPQESIQFKSLFAVALVLFAITLVLNLISNRVVARYRNKYG